MKNKCIFVNAGVGVSQIKNVKYGFGSFRVNDGTSLSTSFDKDSFPLFQGYNTFYAFNVGANLPIKRVGFLLEMGVRNSSIAKATKISPKIGYRQVNYKVGISYNFN